jgi:hypothetical protein
VGRLPVEGILTTQSEGIMMPAVKKRTTLTLDPDVAARLADEVHRQRKPFKQVVNEAIRRGLSGSARRAKLPPFKVKPLKASLRPGIDLTHINTLADQWEDEARLAKLGYKLK